MNGHTSCTIATLLAVFSCAQDPASVEDCGLDSDATYLATFMERAGGDCGPIPSELAQITAENRQPECKKTLRVADDCSVNSEVTCQITHPSTGIAATRQVKYVLRAVGANLVGTLDVRIVLADGSDSCQGLYDARLARQ
jgi:hypothetical protein